MADTVKYLPESRELYRKFVDAHFEGYFEDMRHAGVGPGSGYSYFYRDSEVIQHIRDIVHNIRETFGNVTIPEEFSSPGRLVEAWKGFHDFLVSKNELFEDVIKTLQEKEEDAPDPFRWSQKIHKDVLGLLEEILSMEEVAAYLKPKKSESGAKVASFDVIIITALYDTEFEALKKIPVKLDPYTIAGDNTDYLIGKIGAKSILIATDDRMGMVSSASLSTKLIARFAPKYLIMAGIAAGVKDDEKNYGDILVAKFTWNYESGKYKYDKDTDRTVFIPNPEQIEMDDSLVRQINSLKSDERLMESIHESFVETSKDKKPKAALKLFIGHIASGSAVLSDAKKINSIRKKYQKLIGIDMETYGVYYSAKHIASNNDTKAISIKSISDFADQRKNDKYRNFAAYTSAQFIYNLILKKL